MLWIYNYQCYRSSISFSYLTIDIVFGVSSGKQLLQGAIGTERASSHIGQTDIHTYGRADGQGNL